MEKSERRPFESITGKDLPVRRGALIWVGIFLLLCIAWEMASEWGLISSLYSRPSNVWRDFAVLVTEGTDEPIKGTIGEHVWASCRRVYVGIFIGTVIGYPCALYAMTSSVLRFGLSFILPFAMTTPKVALIYLFVITLGIYEAPKYALGIWAAFLFQFVYVYHGSTILMTRNLSMMNAAEEFTRSRYQLIRYILGPLLLPAFFDALFLSNVTVWTLLIIAEAVNGRQGMGAIVVYAYEVVDVSGIISGVILLSFCGMVTGWIINFVKRQVVWW